MFCYSCNPDAVSDSVYEPLVIRQILFLICSPNLFCLCNLYMMASDGDFPIVNTTC